MLNCSGTPQTGAAGGFAYIRIRKKKKKTRTETAEQSRPARLRLWLKRGNLGFDRGRQRESLYDNRPRKEKGQKGHPVPLSPFSPSPPWISPGAFIRGREVRKRGPEEPAIHGFKKILIIQIAQVRHPLGRELDIQPNSPAQRRGREP